MNDPENLLDRLIRSKTALGRPRDLEAVKQLRYLDRSRLDGE